jgi:hypothetical protein
MAGQVCTTDGRVKVFGREGVECMFASPGQCPTRQLCFLEGKGALLRVTQVHPARLSCIPGPSSLHAPACMPALVA